MSAAHMPVLLEEVMAAAAPLDGALVVDGTFGAGGYSREALRRGAAKVYAFDRDPDAASAGRALGVDALEIVEASFSRMEEELAARGVEAVDAVMLDIGVSSMQLDQAERGFSFREDGPLDMRMSQAGRSAADVVNETEEAELADLIYLYGEERRSRQVARALVAARPLTRTAETAAVVRKAAGQRPGQKTDAATKTFQALRIAVNDELGELERGLAAAERLLRPEGRLVVVSFHSLEDRIVKQFLRERSGGTPAGSRHLPVQEAGPKATFRKPRKQVRAGKDELAGNPRSRSATLRSAVRTSAPAWNDEGGAR
ncbi:16S rRNA (cytosine(1402)-N(4))-methyltransferase [Pacificimonas flava]|uniref:Ribosomal RNA small subunit methyltransferase H n=2 Tax=Pacificimonas TaxID=1960290 RepID=A0A219B9D5_9SPHN|nr:16S rRNA (cytosine(1402)-N(4))-methyltransferase [Pacificimonas flava]